MRISKSIRLPIAVMGGFFILLSYLFGLALEEAVGPIRSFGRQFWISFAMTVSLGAAVFVLSRCRRFSARLADAEEVIAIRFRRKTPSRSLESRNFRILVWILFGVFASLTLIIGGTYLHFGGV